MLVEQPIIINTNIQVCNLLEQVFEEKKYYYWLYKGFQFF